jgi:general secretion pathway protein L
MNAWGDRLQRIGGGALRARSFLAWWWRALATWLPASWQAQLGLSRARLLVWIDGDTLRLARQLDSHLSMLPALPWPQSPDDVATLIGPRLAGLPRHWLLPAATALRRPLRLPAAAGDRLCDVARFEIDRQTPFQPGQVGFDARLLQRRDDGLLDVELVVVANRTLEQHAERAGAWWPGLAGIDVAAADPAAPPLGVNLLPSAQRRRGRDPMRSWNLLLAVVALLAVCAAGAQLLDNRRAAAERLRAQVDAGAQRARAVGAQRQQLVDLIDGADFFARKRAERPTATEVWDELSRRLPPATYLEKFSIEGGRLQLIGLSSEASSLVAKLEGSPLWKTPSLTGVLQSDGSSRRDRFTLTAELVGAPASQEAADGTAQR